MMKTSTLSLYSSFRPFALGRRAVLNYERDQLRLWLLRKVEKLTLERDTQPPEDRVAHTRLGSQCFRLSEKRRQ